MWLFLSAWLLLSAAGCASDRIQIAPLRPTTYYLADEAQISCRGRYRKRRYTGAERTVLKTPKGEAIATVCTRFFRVLSMEGSGRLRDRGTGRQTVNWAGDYRFKVMRKCKMGKGVRGKCLLPFHTIAADLTVHSPGDILFIPEVKGLKLPDGTVHSGIFEVRDTGGAFKGVGAQRVDLFVGTQTDRNNVFRRAGLHHRRDVPAYRLVGTAKQDAQAELKARFPMLY